MTAKEIIDFLSQYPEETEVAIWDHKLNDIITIDDIEYCPDCGIEIFINQR